MAGIGCIWCNRDAHGNYAEATTTKSGMFYIHPGCFQEAIETAEDLKTIRDILDGKRPNDSIESFIARMERFQQRAAGSMKLLREIGLVEERKHETD